jgi:hypothetical protein
MKVRIYDLKTNSFVTDVKISYGLIGEKTSEDDVKDEAWLSAVEDKLVDKDSREKYFLEIIFD